jgi:CGNR zinc finger
MVTVDELSLPLLVELLNGWGAVPRRRAGDRARASRGDLLRRSPELSALGDVVTDEELERVADLVYPVFADPDPNRRASTVSSLLVRSRVRPAVADGEGRLSAIWEVPDPDSAVLAAVAVTLRAQLSARGPERFGTCTSVSCGDVFVDTSPAARRRFCSVTCQNRERIAAFRRRHRAET